MADPKNKYCKDGSGGSWSCKMKIDEATVEWINGSSLGVPFFCLSYTAISPMDIYI